MREKEDVFWAVWPFYSKTALVSDFFPLRFCSDTQSGLIQGWRAGIKYKYMEKITNIPI